LLYNPSVEPNSIINYDRLKITTHPRGAITQNGDILLHVESYGDIQFHVSSGGWDTSNLLQVESVYSIIDKGLESACERARTGLSPSGVERVENIEISSQTAAHNASKAIHEAVLHAFQKQREALISAIQSSVYKHKYKLKEEEDRLAQEERLRQQELTQARKRRREEDQKEAKEEREQKRDVQRRRLNPIHAEAQPAAIPPAAIPPALPAPIPQAPILVLPAVIPAPIPPAPVHVLPAVIPAPIPQAPILVLPAVPQRVRNRRARRAPDPQPDDMEIENVSDENLCTICKTPLAINDRYALPCAHCQWHQHCIERWIRDPAHRSCPECRNPVD